MSQNKTNNNETFDIDFSDLLVQETSVDNKAQTPDTGGLSADDLSFLESLSQIPDIKPESALASSVGESAKPEPTIAEPPKTASHSALVDKIPTETPVEPTQKEAETLVPATPKKSGLFGGKDKVGKNKVGKDNKRGGSDIFAKAPQKSKAAGKKDIKKQIFLILGAMGVILVLGLLWVFLGKSEESASAPEPTPTETQTVTPKPTPEVAPETPEMPVDTVGATEAGATAENTATPTPTGDFAPIDADAIIQAEIPDDPALIKEEIDRLADENSRLLDQAKDIDGILSDTEKLTSAKEEQIALLEAQIAQLEAQKGK